MNTEIQPHRPTEVIARPTERAFEPHDIREGFEMARLLAKSGLVPRALSTPEAVFYTIAAGRELGLTAVQSIRSLHIIDGKIVMAADMIVALVLRSGLCEYFALVESTDKLATYETHRRGAPSATRMSYTIEQAARAGLAGKQNWRNHPEAMLRARCSSALARAVYPDAVQGLFDTDEGEEIRTSRASRGPGHPAPAAPPANDEPPPSADTVPHALQAVQDAIEDIRPPLTAEQAAAIWEDHYDALGPHRDRAFELLELALGEGQKTRFKKLTGEHERKVAAGKALDHARTRIRAATTPKALYEFAESLADTLRVALTEDFWLRRLALCASAREAEGLRARIADIAVEAVRGRVQVAFDARLRELQGPDPEDDGQDSEREAIQDEAMGDGDSQALTAATEKLRGTHGPSHAVSHYLAHRDELPEGARAPYRRATVEHLWQRYPVAVPSREAAEALVSDREAEQARRAA